jgi:hypothetical protein
MSRKIDPEWLAYVVMIIMVASIVTVFWVGRSQGWFP